jgi:DNA polymerase-3 subunit alpha
VLEVPYGTCRPDREAGPGGVKVYLDDSLKPGQEPPPGLRHRPASVKEIVDLARPLEGLIRQDSIHAAGVVIADRPLTDHRPAPAEGRDQEVVTQLGMWGRRRPRPAEMDFLGLRNLDVIDEDGRADRRGRDRADPARRPKTYEMLARGDAVGVFQFESSGMREALRQVKPTSSRT